MRRLLTIGAAGVLLVGLVGPTALAEGDGKKAPSGSLTLYATESASRFISPTGTVDPPEDDPSAFAAGGRLLSVDLLYSDEARTTRVGRNDISCEVTEVTGTAAAPGAATLLCSGVIRLAGGSISWQASLTFDESQEDAEGPFAEVALTGGTGTYRAAGGQALIFDESEAGDESVSRYEIDLLRLRGHR